MTDPTRELVCFRCLQPYRNRKQPCGGEQSANHRFVAGRDAALRAREEAGLRAVTDPTKVERMEVWRCPEHGLLGPHQVSTDDDCLVREDDKLPICGELCDRIEVIPAERLAEVEQALGEAPPRPSSRGRTRGEPHR